MNVRLYQKRKKSRPATKLKKIIATSGGTQVKVERRGQRNIYRRQIKSNLVESSTSDRLIKRDTGGRKKNPVAKILRTPKSKPKVKPSERLYIKFSRKGKKVSQ